MRIAAIQAVMKELDGPATEVLSELRTAKRTMERRKANGSLLPQDSERVYRLAKILAFAQSVLGTREKARHWLDSSNRALGNVSPLSLLETDAGVDEIMNVLGRIEHGVLS